MNRQKMDELIGVIEEFDPSHMDKRYQNLIDFKKELETEGYVVNEVTPFDVECYWVRAVASVNGHKDVSIGYENRSNYDLYKQFMVKKDELDTERA